MNYPLSIQQCWHRILYKGRQYFWVLPFLNATCSSPPLPHCWYPLNLLLSFSYIYIYFFWLGRKAPSNKNMVSQIDGFNIFLMLNFSLTNSCFRITVSPRQREEWEDLSIWSKAGRNICLFDLNQDKSWKIYTCNKNNLYFFLLIEKPLSCTHFLYCAKCTYIYISFFGLENFSFQCDIKTFIQFNNTTYK